MRDTKNYKNKDDGHKVGGYKHRTSEHEENQTRNLRDETVQIANEIKGIAYQLLKRIKHTK